MQYMCVCGRAHKYTHSMSFITDFVFEICNDNIPIQTHMHHRRHHRVYICKYQQRIKKCKYTLAKRERARKGRMFCHRSYAYVRSSFAHYRMQGKNDINNNQSHGIINVNGKVCCELCAQQQQHQHYYSQKDIRHTLYARTHITK